MTQPELARPRVVAHRGVHTNGITENTFEAFEAAVNSGAEMIELDVRRTANQELVILHDHKLGQVTLADHSLDQFEALTGRRPPLLSEVLDWARGRIALDVELKEDGYLEQLTPLLVEFQDHGGGLIVTSFLERLLVQLADLAPQLQRGLLMMFTGSRAGERTVAARASIVLPQMQIFDAALGDDAADSGLGVIVWDYLPQRDGPELMHDQHVRAVITDDVAGALAARG